MPPLLLSLLLACGDRPESEPVDADSDGFAPGPDCNDDDATVHPGADEACNAVDDDCDGVVDEDALDAVQVYADADGDGYGGASEGTACTPGPEQTSVSGDCDDADGGAHPGGVEICNDGRDDDCNGSADDEDAVGGASYYADNDGDGFGGGAATVACAAPAGLTADGSDCDDLDAAVHPGVEELCNGLDDDCDPFTLETGIVSVDGVRYGSIQDAIDAAPDGGTVSLCDGTWFENVRVPKSLVIEGRGADLTIVDGSDFGSVIQVVGAQVDLVVREITLQHGAGVSVEAFGGGANTGGGAIEAYAAGSLELDACVVAESSATYGGGVLGPHAGDTTFSGTTFRDNEARVDGGGALVVSANNRVVDVEGCLFTGNTAGRNGGGLDLVDEAFSGTSTIVDTTFDANVATADFGGYGGGLASSVQMVTLQGVTISNNLAQFGGGFYGGDIDADEKTEVFGNQTYDGGEGGGLYAYGAWRQGHIWGNTASFGGGAAVAGKGSLHEVLIEENHAVEAGGGAAMLSGGEIRDSEVSSNTSDGTGGGLYAADPLYTPIVANTIINSNVAKVWGGGAEIEVDFWSDASDWGTGVTDNSPDDVALLYWEKADPVIYSDFTSPEDFQCDLEEKTCE